MSTVRIFFRGKNMCERTLDRVPVQGEIVFLDDDALKMNWDKEDAVGVVDKVMWRPDGHASIILKEWE